MANMNPATSPEQYGLMEAVAHGTARVKGISKKVAKEFISATPKSVRSKFAKILAEKKYNPTRYILSKWAIHGNTVYFDPNIEENHEEWFARKGWKDFDSAPRGRLIVDRVEKTIEFTSYSGPQGYEESIKIPKKVIATYKSKHPVYGKDYKIIISSPMPRLNPSEDYTVEDMSREWHGRDPRAEEIVEEISTFESDLAELADLEELGVMGADLESEFNIVFKSDRPKLCCDGKGKNLEIVGGDQKLDLKSQGIEQDGKRLIPVGWLVRIVYETDKHHLEGSNGYPESYEHYFAEEFYKESIDPNSFEFMDDWWEEIKEEGLHEQAIEEGRIPMLVYNQTDSKLMIVGGGYTVEDVGIKD